MYRETGCEGGKGQRRGVVGSECVVCAMAMSFNDESKKASVNLYPLCSIYHLPDDALVSEAFQDCIGAAPYDGGCC